MATALNRESNPDPGSPGLVRLTTALAVAQFMLHLWFAVSAHDPMMWLPHAVAWLLDLFVLIVASLVVRGMGRVLQPSYCPTRLLTGGASAALALLGLLLASYPGQLAEFLTFPTNIFRADAATSWYFLTEYLGWSGLWPLLVTVVVVILAARLPGTGPTPRTRKIAALLVTCLAVPFLMGPAPQPLVYSAQDSLRGWLTGGERVVPSLSKPDRTLAPAAVPHSVRLWPDEAQAMKFDHILILVLEGVTTSRFEQEFLARPQGYYATLQDRSAYFAGYHTTNLDSYTSLIALLTSVQVPYRAYADPDSYARANDSPNLIAALGRRGFASLFVSTSQFAPFVPVPNNWTRTLTMRDLPQQERYLQVSGSKVEMGLEDRAAAPAILEFVSTHPRTIVMHEMLFGHSPRWMALTGQSQLEYEDAYLLELARGLEERGLLDRTLLIVVSDHGDRADSALAENYRVPLLISGQGIAPLHTSAFYSHNDFQQIVAHFLAGQPLPAARDSIMTVGSTERWVYGRITAAGESLFIDNDLGAELTRQGTLVARSLFESFQSHLNDFAARFQR